MVRVFIADRESMRKALRALGSGDVVATIDKGSTQFTLSGENATFVIEGIPGKATDLISVRVPREDAHFLSEVVDISSETVNISFFSHGHGRLFVNGFLI